MKKIYNFAAHYIQRGGKTRLMLAAGFFYACMLQSIYGSIPPCGVLMHPLPLWCNATGKVEPFFIFTANKYFKVMHKTRESQARKAITEQNAVNTVIPIELQNDIISLKRMKEFYSSYAKKEPNSLTSGLVKSITENIDMIALDISGLAGEAFRDKLFYGKEVNNE